MSKTTIEFDAKIPHNMVRNFSKASRAKLGDAIEKVGRILERESKMVAPHVTGNLKRQIDFKREGLTGMVRAKADYSSYVHGPPYHHGGNRKITPFFTMARNNTTRQTDQILTQAVADAVKTSTK